MGTYKDLTGQKFGRLTVIKSFTKNKRIYCECICECGNKTKKIVLLLKKILQHMD